MRMTLHSRLIGKAAIPDLSPSSANVLVKSEKKSSIPPPAQTDMFITYFTNISSDKYI